MVKNVYEKEYWHLNNPVPGRPCTLWTIGQRIVVGNELNPFFEYYETHTERFVYKIRRGDGTVDEVRAVKYLKEMERSDATPGNNYRAIAREIAQHFMMLSRELIWENVRLKEFSQCPSRQRGVWLIPNEGEVHRWLPAFDRVQSIAKVVASGKAHHCDQGLLLSDIERLSATYENARRYWRGDLSSEYCLEEVLFEGALEVIELRDPPSSAA